jgi:hypothetical protein
MFRSFLTKLLGRSSSSSSTGALPRAGKANPRSARHRLARPRLEVLEDRTVPSGFGRAAGGPSIDGGEAVAHDQAGDVFVAGFFQGSIEFTGGSGRGDLTGSGTQDAFVAKYSSDGTFDWAVSMGGMESAAGATGIGVDARGNVYIDGSFVNHINVGNMSFDSGGDFHTFVAKLDGSGNVLWGHQFAGCNNIAYGLAVSSDGSVHTTGGWTGPTLDLDPANPGTHTVDMNADPMAITPSGPANYLVKLDTNGAFVWANTALSTQGIVNGLNTKHDVVVDSQGNVYTASDFQQGPVVFMLGSRPFFEGPIASEQNGTYVAKFDGATGAPIWSQVLAVSNDAVDETALAVDPGGAVVATGWFTGYSLLFNPGGPQQGNVLSDPQGNGLAFVAKLDASGNFMWARQIGNTSSRAEGHGVATDQVGNVYVTGFYTGSAYFGNQILTSQGGEDVFVSKLDPNGNFWIALDQGGISDDTGHDITVDAQGFVDITGQFATLPGSPALFGPAHLDSAGATDAFVAKLSLATVQLTPGNILQIFGDRIDVLDNGMGAITLMLDGSQTMTFSHISRIDATVTGGNDVFRYMITGATEGSPVHPADLDVHLLGRHDVASFDLEQATLGSNWHVNVSASAGDDTVSFLADHAVIGTRGTRTSESSPGGLFMNLDARSHNGTFIVAVLDSMVNGTVMISGTASGAHDTFISAVLDSTVNGAVMISGTTRGVHDRFIVAVLDSMVNGTVMISGTASGAHDTFIVAVLDSVVNGAVMISGTGAGANEVILLVVQDFHGDGHVTITGTGGTRQSRELIGLLDVEWGPWELPSWGFDAENPTTIPSGTEGKPNLVHSGQLFTVDLHGLRHHGRLLTR